MLYLHYHKVWIRISFAGSRFLYDAVKGNTDEGASEDTEINFSATIIDVMLFTFYLVARDYRAPQCLLYVESKA